MVLNFLKSSYEKVKAALSKTRSFLTQKLHTLFSKKIDAETLEELEQILYEADLGVKTAQSLTKKIEELYRANPSLTSEQLIQAIQQEMVKSLEANKTLPHPTPATNEPIVFLIVGVNGNGKTTSVAKLAKRFSDEGKKVLVGAADTFRAAAIEQLELWAQRLNIDLVKGAPNSDPAAVAFDTLTAAKARKADVVIIDTAGRLHTKTALMQELNKIHRTCKKVISTSPHQTLLVLDATTGQNALDQASVFQQFTPLNGLILTKLDGTAKGGIVFQIHEKLHIPIQYVGVGEGAEDLIHFDANSFVKALFE